MAVTNVLKAAFKPPVLTFAQINAADGSIWKGDLLTGVGEVVVPGDGGMTIGLNHDKRSGYRFAAAGTSGASKKHIPTNNGSSVW